MGTYDFDCSSFLGMSHCGSVTADGTGSVELTDDEVAALVALMKEKDSSDVEEIGLKEALPEIYEKLDAAATWCDEHGYEPIFMDELFEFNTH